MSSTVSLTSPQLSISYPPIDSWNDLINYINYLDSIYMDLFIDRCGNLIKLDPNTKLYHIVDNSLRPYSLVNNIALTSEGYPVSITYRQGFYRIKSRFRSLTPLGDNVLALRQSGYSVVFDNNKKTIIKTINRIGEFITSYALSKNIALIITPMFKCYRVMADDETNRSYYSGTIPRSNILHIRRGVITTDSGVHIFDGHRLNLVPMPDCKIIDAAPLIQSNYIICYMIGIDREVYCYNSILGTISKNPLLSSLAVISPWVRFEIIDNILLIINGRGESFIIDRYGIVHQSNIPPNQL